MVFWPLGSSGGGYVLGGGGEGILGPGIAGIQITKLNEQLRFLSVLTNYRGSRVLYTGPMHAAI
jgi:hypothetical protein